MMLYCELVEAMSSLFQCGGRNLCAKVLIAVRVVGHADAIMPTLMQTLEATPVFVHAGTTNFSFCFDPWAFKESLRLCRHVL